MISSYLAFRTTYHDQVADEITQEKLRLTKEFRFINKNTMDVILQSIRRASKLRPPKIPDRVHVKNYRNALNDLFSFACELRFALAPYLMITTPNYPNILIRHDAAVTYKALQPVMLPIKKYIRSLYLKFSDAQYRIYIQGLRYRPDNELLFTAIFERISPVKTVKGLRTVLDNLFDYCAIPPDLYKIYTTNEFIRRGYYVPVLEDAKLIPIVIMLDQPGFPFSNFSRGWEVIRAQKDKYYMAQLPNNVCLSTADAIKFSSIK